MTYLAYAVVIALAVMLYFGPAAEAYAHKHPHRVAIFYLNALLGWTVFGWILALLWAKVPVAHHAART